MRLGLFARPMLTDERIRELYETATLDPEELSRYRRFLARLATQSDDELLAPTWQRELWLARDVTGIGPGEIVDVNLASQDQELARELVALRLPRRPALRPLPPPREALSLASISSPKLGRRAPGGDSPLVHPL